MHHFVLVSGRKVSIKYVKVCCWQKMTTEKFWFVNIFTRHFVFIPKNVFHRVSRDLWDGTRPARVDGSPDIDQRRLRSAFCLLQTKGERKNWRRKGIIFCLPDFRREDADVFLESLSKSNPYLMRYKHTRGKSKMKTLAKVQGKTHGPGKVSVWSVAPTFLKYKGC